MNKIDEWILDTISKYPTIYPNKSKALAHALLGHGNGYEWVDGDLCNIFSDVSEPFEDFVDDPQSMHDLQTNMVLDAVRNSPDLVLGDSINFDFNDITRLCEYSLIFNLPDNMTKEWANLAGEVLHAIETALVRFHREANNFLNSKANRLAKTTRASYDAMYGPTDEELAERARIAKEIVDQIKAEEGLTD
jgi:hypothetical protein